MALGAPASHVCYLVLHHAGTLALCGAAIGLALAWPVSRALQSLLFGVTAGDVFSWLLAPVLLILVAVLSSFGAARRAARIDPAVTLRAE